MAFGVSPFQSAASQASAVISTKLWLAIIIYIVDKFELKEFFLQSFLKISIFLLSKSFSYISSWDQPWRMKAFLSKHLCLTCIGFPWHWHYLIQSVCYYYIHDLLSLHVMLLSLYWIHHEYDNICFTNTIHVTLLMIALIKRLCFVGYKPPWSWGSRWVDCQVLRGEVRGGLPVPSSGRLNRKQSRPTVCSKVMTIILSKASETAIVKWIRICS